MGILNKIGLVGKVAEAARAALELADADYEMRKLSKKHVGNHTDTPCQACRDLRPLDVRAENAREVYRKAREG